MGVECGRIGVWVGAGAVTRKGWWVWEGGGLDVGLSSGEKSNKRSCQRVWLVEWR